MWIVLGIERKVFVDLGGITAISKNIAVDVDLHGISPHYFFQAKRTHFQKDLRICQDSDRLKDNYCNPGTISA